MMSFSIRFLIFSETFSHRAKGTRLCFCATGVMDGFMTLCNCNWYSRKKPAPVKTWGHFFRMSAANWSASSSVSLTCRSSALVRSIPSSHAVDLPRWQRPYPAMTTMLVFLALPAKLILDENFPMTGSSVFS